MNHSHPLHKASLVDVQVAFEHWRSMRTSRQSTPEHLRSLAVALLEQHVPFAICKALGVNGTALKQWAKQTPVTSQTPLSPSRFVTLPEEPKVIVPNAAVSDPAVLISLPNGVQISVMQGFSLNQVLAAASALGASA